MRALCALVSVPVAVEQAVEDEGLGRGVGGFVFCFLVAGFVEDVVDGALGVELAGECEGLAVGAPEWCVGAGDEVGELDGGAHASYLVIPRREPELAFCNKDEAGAVGGEAARLIRHQARW